MVKLHYIRSDAERFEVDAPRGSTVMENAVRNAIPGIDAECGGACACATCHVYVDEAWMPLLDEQGPLEADMMSIACDIRPNSRLSCQIRVSDRLDGLVVRIPARQS